MIQPPARAALAVSTPPDQHTLAGRLFVSSHSAAVIRFAVPSTLFAIDEFGSDSAAAICA
jgi:hypothetical protein